MVNNNLVGGFSRLAATPLKNDGMKVSWDEMTFPSEWKNNPNVPNHQPDKNHGGSYHNNKIKF